MSVITLRGNVMQTMGTLPSIGSQAPDFTVTKTDLSEIRLKNYLGKTIILNIFPSLDTETCATAMQQFNEIANQFENILILCVSTDLPFAQKRFFNTKHLENVLPVSVFRHPNFGQTYGVTIMDGPLAGLLSRAVIILDERGKVIYTQQVEEISHDPDYAAMTDAIKQQENNKIDA